MASKYVAPFIGDAFNCPHCGALAHQSWFKAYIRAYDEGYQPGPVAENFRTLIGNLDWDNEAKARTIAMLRRKQSGAVFPYDGNQDYASELVNADVAQCFSCKELSFWLAQKLIYPATEFEVQPSSDMPENVRSDFLEALKIGHDSPRGSAALLRLCIQKLCVHLGGKGCNLNDDVALLVRNGLPSRMQKALDVVSVIGNEAVHPGKLDLRDDQQIARKLLDVVNIIVDTMITKPNTIDSLFDNLPESSRLAIAKRDTN